MLQALVISLAAGFLPGAAMAASGPNYAGWLQARSINGSLPVYRNTSYCIDDRVEDLLSRMTLEEKAGQMFQAQMCIGSNYTLDTGSYDPNAPRLWNSTEICPRRIAGWYNLLQERALNTRLGIPITLSTDPRHHFAETVGASVAAGGFSLFPETLGLTAIRDTQLVREFANIVRQEYISVGIKSALHPQIDLATEPRWGRILNSWSEDANLTAEMFVPYIKGLQGDELGSTSVTTVTKHFPGGGTVQNGDDSHFDYGKNQTYPGDNMEYHLIPFRAAIAAGARQIMPYYSRPIETQYGECSF